MTKNIRVIGHGGCCFFFFFKKLIMFIEYTRLFIFRRCLNYLHVDFLFFLDTYNNYFLFN